MLILHTGENPERSICPEEEEYCQSLFDPQKEAIKQLDGLSLSGRLTFPQIQQTDVALERYLAIGYRVPADQRAAGGHYASETGRGYVGVVTLEDAVKSKRRSQTRLMMYV